MISPTFQTGAARYTPVTAKTTTLDKPIAALGHDCIKLVVVRDGTALLLTEQGPEPVARGTVVAINNHVPCGCDPEGKATVTTLYLDTDYAIDQVFWQHSNVIADRHAARGFIDAVYTEPVQVIRLAETDFERLAPLLDELVALSEERLHTGRFFRMQALVSVVVDMILPHLTTAPLPATLTHHRAHLSPSLPRWRRFVPIRPEICEVEAAMRADIARPWPLATLGEIAHLSGSQVARVFVQTYGKTPLAYLSILRIEEMTRLLRETDLTTAAVGRRVGWNSRLHAARVFRRYVGVTPAQYRLNGPPAFAVSQDSS